MQFAMLPVSRSINISYLNDIDIAVKKDKLTNL